MNQSGFLLRQSRQVAKSGQDNSSDHHRIDGFTNHERRLRHSFAWLTNSDSLNLVVWMTHYTHLEWPKIIHRPKYHNPCRWQSSLRVCVPPVRTLCVHKRYVCALCTACYDVLVLVLVLTLFINRTTESSTAHQHPPWLQVNDWIIVVVRTVLAVRWPLNCTCSTSQVHIITLLRTA